MALVPYIVDTKISQILHTQDHSLRNFINLKGKKFYG